MLQIIRDLAYLTLQLAKLMAVVASGYAMLFVWFIVTP